MNPFLTPVVPEPTVRGRVYRAPEMTGAYTQYRGERGPKFTMGHELSESELAIMERDGNSPFSWEA